MVRIIYKKEAVCSVEEDSSTLGSESASPAGVSACSGGPDFAALEFLRDCGDAEACLL